MKVIAAYDAEPCSRFALTQLASAALPDNTEVIVASFADILVPPGSAIGDMALGTGLPEPVIDMRRAAQSLVDAAQQRAEEGATLVRVLGKPWKITARSIADTPAWGVVQLAEDERADLIVTGSHNRSGMARFFLGSVAQKALQEAHCSVRIVRPITEIIKTPRVVVGIDGSDACRAAVRSIAARPWPAGTHFTCLTVIDSQFLTATLWQALGGAAILGETVKHEAAAAEAALAEATAILHAHGHETGTAIAHGDPRDLIPAEAENQKASCLLLAARGRHHAERRRLGTVAAAVAARAHCTVEIVRA